MSWGHPCNTEYVLHICCLWDGKATNVYFEIKSSKFDDTKLAQRNENAEESWKHQTLLEKRIRTSRPASPGGPANPGGPTGPGGPRSPAEPDGPCLPGSPYGPQKRMQCYDSHELLSQRGEGE